MHACMHVCMYMYVCMCIYIYIDVYTYIDIDGTTDDMIVIVQAVVHISDVLNKIERQCYTQDKRGGTCYPCAFLLREQGNRFDTCYKYALKLD